MGILDAFDEFASLKKAVESIPSAIREMAVNAGLETLPIVWCVIKKGPEGWELVSVSLSRELLPEPLPGELLVRCMANLP